MNFVKYHIRVVYVVLCILLHYGNTRSPPPTPQIEKTNINQSKIPTGVTRKWKKIWNTCLNIEDIHFKNTDHTHTLQVIIRSIILVFIEKRHITVEDSVLGRIFIQRYCTSNKNSITIITTTSTTIIIIIRLTVTIRTIMCLDDKSEQQ